MSFAAELLAFPDLFPVRHSGERWGGKRLLLDFAGGPYALHGLSARQRDGLARRYGELCRPEPLPGDTLEVQVFRAPESDFRELESKPWRDYPLELDPAPDAVRVASRRFVGRLDWRPELAAALWTPVEGPAAERVGVFENFLRVLAAYRLAERGGVLLHSAGVVHRGRAYLFVGPSGAGKTTIARISRDAGKTVLSDDMNVIRAGAERGSGAVAESLPFAGDLGRLAGPAGSYPLAGLFRLEQAPAHAREPLEAAPALAALLANAPFLNSDPWRLDLVSENLTGLLARVPLETLAFRPDPGFWPLLSEGVA